MTTMKTADLAKRTFYKNVRSKIVTCKWTRYTDGKKDFEYTYKEYAYLCIEELPEYWEDYDTVEMFKNENGHLVMRTTSGRITVETEYTPCRK